MISIIWLKWYGPDDIGKTWEFNDQIVQLFVDSKSRVWIGTKRASVAETNLYLLEDMTKEPIFIEKSKLDIQDFLELSDGSIIVSTYGQGVQRLIEDEKGIRFQPDSRFSEMKGGLVFKVYQDKHNNIYLAVNFNRLEVYRLVDDKISFVKTIDNVGNCKDFYDNPVDTSVWIASANGILRLDPKSYEQRYLNETDGLPQVKLYSITKDKGGLFWLKTERGLLKYDPVEKQSVQYGIVDGIRPIIGNTHPSLITDEGVIWMAGQDGLNVFHPDSIQTLRSPPTPQIVQISINEAPYETSFSYSAIDSLKLSYNENTVAFDFVPCQYSDPNNVKFQYRLIGYNDEWVESKGSGFARYFSLPPGQYNFEARTANSEGSWSPVPANISISISPPWWATNWAYFFYGITVISVLLYLRRSERRKQKLKLLQEKRKLEQERRVNNELRKVDKLKDQFLANTSHELRTPLNGIIGLAESLVDGATGKLPSKTVQNLQMIASSGKRLSNLVNDILDFSKLKSDDLELNLKPVDLYTAVDVVTTLLRPLRKDESIIIKNEVAKDLPLVMADENRLQQILYNIVGNALKFTHEGHIKVYSNIDNDSVSVSIEDTGIGIPEKDFDKIFRSFEQVDGSTSRQYEGTGLGLSVTKQLVELHGGEIGLKSEVGKGSTFTFSLPKSTVARGEVDLNPEVDFEKTQLIREEVEESFEDSPVIIAEDAFKILIVDDEPVNRTVLENHLTTAGYATAQAHDGMMALEMIEKDHFDLILLDVMMPGMSGFEVCKKIRETHPAISLPILMLTAKNRISDLVEGFNMGANDYLAKPFSKDELLARIHTHLNLLSIYSATGRFVPFEFLNAIGHDEITQVKRGDHTETEVTVLFADIREFTRLSESMTPTENFQFVNTFVGRMGPVIQRNRGFVNQYLGDGIMAIFPHNSEDAINAAWQMLKELEVFNSQLVEEGKEAIRIGIGLHTGPLIMGIIGDEHRTDPATIADAVNTSSRLEGLTKYYKAPIIVSEVSLRQYKDHDPSQFRFLGKVKLKGKKHVVGIYECITGDSEQVKEYKIKTSGTYDKGIHAYQNGQLEEALTYFKLTQGEGIEDAVVDRFIDRIETLLEGGVPPDWQAIEVMTDK